MDSPVLVSIPHEWREKASQYAKQAGYPSMNTGKLAEYAVIDHFRRQGVFVREDLTPPDKPDYFDINLGNAPVDVKSCMAPAKELRVTKDLFDRGRRFAFYIGVQISKDRKLARIYGFCTKDEVAKGPVKMVGTRVCYVLPFSSLRPIEKLVNSFRKSF